MVISIVDFEFFYIFILSIYIIYSSIYRIQIWIQLNFNPRYLYITILPLQNTNFSNNLIFKRIICIVIW